MEGMGSASSNSPVKGGDIWHMSAFQFLWSQELTFSPTGLDVGCSSKNRL